MAGVVAVVAVVAGWLWWRLGWLGLGWRGWLWERALWGLGGGGVAGLLEEAGDQGERGPVQAAVAG
jgi:hypothetical protein